MDFYFIGGKRFIFIGLLVCVGLVEDEFVTKAGSLQTFNGGFLDVR